MRVIGIPLAVVAAVLFVLVALGVTGTSTGVVQPLVEVGADEQLLAGNPQPIRSDEWFVQTAWTISQVELGLPLRNEVFPGGMDATVQHDLPAGDWSMAFRPHLLGFFGLDLSQAMSLKWWLPSFILIAAAYLLAIVLLPRRPVAAIMLAVGFVFNPFFQWWWLSITIYPAAWALVVMAAIVWGLKSRRRAGAWILGALAGYLTVTVGTGIYVPFIVPAALVTLAFGVGAVLMRWQPEQRFRQRLSGVVPVLVGGAVGCAVLALWLVTRWQTIVGFVSTVYPGERLEATGAGGVFEFAALFSGVQSGALATTQGAPFGVNSSEASTFLVPGLFLVPVIVWIIVDQLRRRRELDTVSLGLLAVGAIMAAFVLIPGWDAVAHALMLDRTTTNRLRLGFGLLSFVMVIVTGARLGARRDEGEARSPVWPAAVSGSFAALAAGLVIAILIIDVGGLAAARELFSLGGLALGLVVTVALVASVVFFGLGRMTAGATALLVSSLLVGVGVNPLYRGVFDLRETAMAQEIERLAIEDSGSWVGVAGSPLTTMLLVQTAVPSFNGFQSAPSEEMWGALDPEGDHEETWNRLANVSWEPGVGEPVASNPAPDQIRLTFDSCSDFAQENVRWVISEAPLAQPCLHAVSSVTDGPTTMYFAEVVPAA